MSNTKAIATRKPETTTVEVQTLGLVPAAMRKAVDPEAFVSDAHHIGAQVATIGAAGNGLMWEQSLLLANTDVTNVIGSKDQPYSGIGQVGEVMGLSKSYTSRLHRAGRGVVWFGVRAGSEDWTTLCHANYGASSAYFTEYLAKKRTEVPTKVERDGFRKALKQATADRLAKVDPPKSSRKAQGETDQTEPEQGDAKVIAPVVGDAMDLLRRFEETLHGLSDEAAHTAREEGFRILRNDQKRRAALAAKESDESPETVEGEVLATA